MAKKKSSNQKSTTRKSTNKPKPIKISGHQFWSKSGHLITSRPYGSAGRFTVLLGFVFLLFMVLMSVGVLYQTPLNPVVWATIAFFGGLLVLLLIEEKNIFPALCREKLIWAVCAWFIVFMLAPYIAMNISYFSFPIFIIIIVFFIILVPIVARIAVPENKWVEVKENVKYKVTHPRTIGKKEVKKTKKSTNGLTGINRKRKIYRR